MTSLAFTLASSFPAVRALSHALLLTLVLGIAGCGAGSGVETSQNPQTDPPPVSNYNGPAPATEDVQRFKINVWDNLVPNNRCGNCHNESQAPRFVRSDDINLAYEAANSVVNLSEPGQSLMVAKVRGGHNCWLTSDDACGDIIQSYIEAWASGSVGGSGKEIALTPPPIRDPGSSKAFPDDSSLFAATVHPLLTEYCAGCHTDDAAVPQSPYFASAAVDAAYEAAKPKIDLDNPANSRFVLRLRFEFHNCWDNDCAAAADEMEAAIAQMAAGIAPTQVDPDLVTSKALSLPDGIVASSGGRHEANVIALYEFKTGNGTTAFDTSGVEPTLNLTLSGTYNWVGGWGIQLVNGKAQGSTVASSKLHDRITATNEYSIETWVAPANVTQDGPARIITYSGGTDRRNFMLGQTLYNYEAFNRSTNSDADGAPALATADADEDLQATLQHVVVTFDPTNGRRIYVNGEYTGDADGPGGLLTDWDDTFAFALGSEVDNSNRFAGTIRLVAIHNRVLTPEQIRQNYDVGVGEKYFLLFDVSEHVGIDQAYVVFEVSQFDSYAYLFNEPFFVILDGAATPGSIPMQGMRIGINGREAAVGQAYRNLDVTINDAAYSVEGRQYLSTLGTVIALEKGPAEDEFFLTFERLGDSTHVVTEPAPPIPASPPDVPRGPDVGIRNFAEVNATMARVTGVPVTTPNVKATYDTVFQALPVSTDIENFLSSQQMGITQLAIQYCSALMDNGTLRTATFPGFNFGASVASAYGSPAARDALVDPLIARMVGVGIATQPDATTVRSEVDDLIDRLATCSGPSCTTVNVAKGACAAVLGSAALLVQ
jgi:hypothetical protein